jgi:hypothetical protein
MIQYESDLFGLHTLYVWHGSAVFRAFLPALFSTGLLLVYHYLWGDDLVGAAMQSPYVITVFVAFFAFMLTFRLNYSYQRYWEAATHVHQMSSKWLDSAICLSSFHYQCQQYDDVRPLTFGAHENDKMENQTRERERLKRQTLEECEMLVQEAAEKSQKGGFFQRLFFRTPKVNSPTTTPSEYTTATPVKTFKVHRKQAEQEQNYFAHPKNGLHRSQRGPEDQSSRKAWRAGFASGKKVRATRTLRLTGLDTTVPSLFLQEATHLYSLLSAVAMSTLRNDIEGTQSPLCEYIPGRPFPPVNPDELSSDIKMVYHETNRFWNCLYFILGIDRGPKQRTLYNAARPFGVIGGVSDEEARLLQQARGPYAQMALCNMWLKEFVSREYLNGSTGKVAPPIVGRVYQFCSDGVSAYVKQFYTVESDGTCLIFWLVLTPFFASLLSATINAGRLRLSPFLFPSIKVPYIFRWFHYSFSPFYMSPMSTLWALPAS